MTKAKWIVEECLKIESSGELESMRAQQTFQFPVYAQFSMFHTVHSVGHTRLKPSELRGKREVRRAVCLRSDVGKRF